MPTTGTQPSSNVYVFFSLYHFTLCAADVEVEGLDFSKHGERAQGFNPDALLNMLKGKDAGKAQEGAEPSSVNMKATVRFETDGAPMEASSV